MRTWRETDDRRRIQRLAGHHDDSDAVTTSARWRATITAGGRLDTGTATARLSSRRLRQVVQQDVAPAQARAHTHRTATTRV